MDDRCAHHRAPTPPEIRARGHVAIEAYRNALRQGSTSVRRVPIMLIGQERSGKTSLKKSLIGEIFNPNEDSTLGIDKDPSYFQVTTEIWKPRKKDEAVNSETALSYEYRAAQLIVSNLTKEEKEARPTRSTALSSVDSIKARNVNQSDSALSLEDPSSSSEAPNEIAATPTASADIERHVPDEIAALVEKLLLEAKKEEKEEQEIFSVLWDFGGQSVYYVTHPLFLTPRAMYFLVYDLSQDPHDKANPLVKQGMFSALEDSFHLKTNLDYLDFWMTSVASLARPDEDLPAHANPKSEVLPETLPPVFLVCTHADQPYGEKSARTLARKVYGFIRSKPNKTQLYDDVFVVDNTKSGLESECSEVVRLREEALAVAKNLPQMKEVIPIKWLKYEKALQQTKKDGLKFVSLDRAKEIAISECQIVDDQEFATLIDFLHDQKILLHFDDTPVLNNLVVLDLQWLIDVFKKVITITPYESIERKFEGLWRKLETEGILEDTLLQHVWGPLLDQQQTLESLIAVMEKFSLLCRWPSSDASGRKEYLVPSMLMSLPPQEVISLVASAQIPPLLLKFESGQVLPGLFPRLILQFFQWGKDEVWSTVNPQLYQNFARFYTSGDDDCSVILRCHSSSIEVVIHRGNLSVDVVEGTQSKLTISSDEHHHTFETACARVVHRQLGLMLECMRKEFCWMKNIKYKIGVICPVCCQGGAVKYCRTHHQQQCEQEECLHFWSKAELSSAKTYITCTNSATAKNNKIQVKQFAAWFPCQGEQASQQADGECEKRLLPSDEGDENTSLAIPHEVVESLLSQSCDSKEVVLQLKKNLQLGHAALQQPEPGTKRLIRCLAGEAKRSNRLDVVKHLREITPAGTTGPLLPGNLDIQNVPVRQMRELTIDLSSGDEWKEVAETLGLSPKEIRYLDKRTLNPCDAALAFISQQRHINVDKLYDVLNECELPMLADTL